MEKFSNLKLDAKPSEEEISQYEGKLYSELDIRDLEMEYRVLMRINCHKGQFNNLFKNSSSEFRRKNKYNEILPYMHNQVKLKCLFENDKFQDYYNASYINVSDKPLDTIVVVTYRAKRGEDLYCSHGSNY